MYITVPNPLTDTGRGCRVYYLVGNEPLKLREVPWECSAVYHEAFFWKGNNVTEITYAKVQDTLPAFNSNEMSFRECTKRKERRRAEI